MEKNYAHPPCASAKTENKFIAPNSSGNIHPATTV